MSEKPLAGGEKVLAVRFQNARRTALDWAMVPKPPEPPTAICEPSGRTAMVWGEKLETILGEMGGVTHGPFCPESTMKGVLKDSTPTMSEPWCTTADRMLLPTTEPTETSVVAGIQVSLAVLSLATPETLSGLPDCENVP